MNDHQYQLLLDILAQPTAPFREEHVIATVGRALVEANVPFFADPVGNLVVGVGSRKEYLSLAREKSAEPLRVFIAHMDHPGFHGVEWLASRRLKIQWHGGAPVKHLAGTRVWLADKNGWAGSGTLANVQLTASKRTIDSAEVRLDTPLERPAKTLYGGFQFRAPVWRSGQRLYTKAADDLAGVFAIVAMAQEFFRRRRVANPPFLGLLTRAEEVGFIGAIGHFELGWLDQSRGRRPVVCVSLEASRTLPGAIVGKGPVVRLGDRRTVFQPGGLKVLADIAEQTLSGRHQRRIMDGGTCEATAASVYGFDAIGLSVPLGNYHNQGFEGGPDCFRPDGPAPEFVHLEDIAGELALCRALLKPGLPWAEPWHKQRQTFRKNLRHYRRLL